jgi:hypothetical protein
VAAFFSPIWRWIVLGLPILFLLTTLWGLKQKRWNYVPELSPKANEMLQKFGHFYCMPFAGRDFSASASTVMWAGVILAIICLFHRFWWGIAIGLASWFIMGPVARAFDPTLFLVDDSERFAHDEIISFIYRRRNEKWDKIDGG